MISTRKRKDWRLAILAAVLAAAGVAWQYGLGGARRWSEPLYLHGDAVLYGVIIKLASEGCWPPAGSKTAAALGAPLAADWNDYPVSEDWLFWVWGLVARFSGTWTALNVAVVVAAALAAITFFHVARRVGAWRPAACLGAFLFAISPYLFCRNIGHFHLAQYWHVPLLLYAAFRAARWPAGAWPLKRFGPLAAIAFLGGVMCVYYLYFWLLVMALVAAWRAVRAGSLRAAAPTLALCAVAVGGFLAANADTFADLWRNGLNSEPISRPPKDAELYCLRPAALAMPSRHHRGPVMRMIGRAFDGESVIQGETPSPYLGVIGVLSLGAMMAMAFVELARGQVGPSARWGGMVLWLGGACSVGGLNSLFGLVGFFLFRGANRVSIFIMALALLFGVRLLWRALGRWRPAAQWSVAGLLAVVGFWDQPGARESQEQITEVRRKLEADAALGGFLQANLPRGSMIFQLPAIDYPGNPADSALREYELFRPYLSTDGLRFSHGHWMGRPAALWHRRVGAMETGVMLDALRAAGFRALYIDKRGYQPARFSALKEELQSLGVGRMFENEIAVACLLPQAGP